MAVGALTQCPAYAFATSWSIAKHYLVRGCESATLYLGTAVWETVGDRGDAQVSVFMSFRPRRVRRKGTRTPRTPSVCQDPLR